MELVGTPIGGFGAISRDGENGGILKITTEQSKIFFKELVITKDRVLDNALGYFTFVEVGRRGRLDIHTIKKVSRGLFQAAIDCDWNPKGKVYFGMDAITTCPLELMMSECFDGLTECLKVIKGDGNDHYNFLATPEGEDLWDEILDLIYQGKQDDFSDIVWFSNHPSLAESQASGAWETGGSTTEEWADYYQQQTEIGCDGLMTKIDVMKEAGLSQMNVPLGDYNAETKTYTGSAIALFESCFKAMKPTMKVAKKKAGQGGGGLVFKVHPAIFNAYRSELMEKSAHIEESFRLCIDVTTGYFADSMNALRYQGVPIICMDEWEAFDDLVGIQNPRCLLTVAGNALLGFDNEPILRQGVPAGVIIQQSPLIRDKGRTDILQRLEVGMGWATPDWIVNASAKFSPAA